MKHTFKILLTLTLILIFHISYSQDVNNEKKYVQEIKNLFRDATNKKFKLPFILGSKDSLTLPSYFTNYVKYYDIKRSFDKINLPYFDQSNNFKLNLNKEDCVLASILFVFLLLCFR